MNSTIRTNYSRSIKLPRSSSMIPHCLDPNPQNSVQLMTRSAAWRGMSYYFRSKTYYEPTWAMRKDCKCHVSSCYPYAVFKTAQSFSFYRIVRIHPFITYFCCSGKYLRYLKNARQQGHAASGTAPANGSSHSLARPSQFSADIPTGAREEQAGRGCPEPSPFSNLANLSSTRLLTRHRSTSSLHLSTALQHQLLQPLSLFTRACKHATLLRSESIEHSKTLE